jgi:hypothetical protein
MGSPLSHFLFCYTCIHDVFPHMPKEIWVVATATLSARRVAAGPTLAQSTNSLPSHDAVRLAYLNRFYTL